MNINHAKSFLLIFSINLLLVFLYGFFLDLPIRFSDFPEVGTSSCLDYFVACFLPDIYIYLGIVEKSALESIANQFSDGLTALHVLPYLLVDSNWAIYLSFVVNSALVGICFSYYFIKKNYLKIYLLFIPFFIYYSYGMTKEIPLTCSIIIIINSEIFKITRRKLLFGFPLLIFSRPQFTPLILFLRFMGHKYFSRFLIFLYIISPIFTYFLPADYISRGEIAYSYQKYESFTKEIDYLKFETIGLSLLGWFTTIIKSLSEPFIYIFREGFDNIYMWTSILSYFVSAYYIYIKRKLIDRSELNFIFLYILIATYIPISHHRYLLPLVVAFGVKYYFKELPK
jgi:hypothetical protein